MKSESVISSEIQDFLNKIGVTWFWRNQVFKGRVKGGFLQTGKAGVFDLVIMDWGYIIFAENKTKTGDLRDKQKEFKAFLIANNYNYVILRSVDDLKVYLEELGVVCWI